MCSSDLDVHRHVLLVEFHRRDAVFDDLPARVFVLTTLIKAVAVSGTAATDGDIWKPL